MKKILTLTTVCAILCLAFASCKSNMSITKRHYNNGYYIAHTKGKQAVSPLKEEKTSRVTTKKSLYSIQKPAEQNNLSGYSNPNPVQANSIAANNEKKPVKAISKRKVSQLLKRSISITTAPTRVIKRALISKKVISDGESDGLSLFWIIILVILILWAFGFFGGYLFGGLIHLLLVVALILFILWLLHII